MNEAELAKLGIRIKPLEWEAFGRESIRAETVLGRYDIIWGFPNGQYALDVPKAARTHSWHANLDAAKSAAQADYAARIPSVFELIPVTQ